MGSIYDLNGYLGPVTLKGKEILQQMCKDKLDWDSTVPEYNIPVPTVGKTSLTGIVLFQSTIYLYPQWERQVRLG